MTEHRDAIMHHAHPDRARLVWESAAGPVLVEDMGAEWLRRAIARAERQGIPSPALPAMRARLATLEAGR